MPNPPTSPLSLSNVFAILAPMNFTLSSTLLLLLFLLSIIIIIIIISIFFNKRRRRRPKSIPNLNQQLELEEQEQDSPASWLLPPPPPIEDNEEDAAAAGGGGGEEKRRKKKAKKKRSDAEGVGGCPERDQAAAAAVKMGAAGCPFPFSSPTSATQRKMKVQYDELVKSNQARQLTMAQVGQFVNCLVDAKNELQQKSEIIRRSFKIKKALLVKADRSSFDRLCQQIYKLEAEQKRLEEDVAVYNLLQEQLKLSPAYKTMLEVGTSMELQGSQDQAAVDFCDISFEELLAQEKKDSFWQRNGKLRSFAS